jgi:hypothetical protein
MLVSISERPLLISSLRRQDYIPAELYGAYYDPGLNECGKEWRTGTKWRIL